MIATILAILATAFAANYHKGETFSYTYNSVVDTSAGTEGEASSTRMDVTLTATFTVLSTPADGAYMKLVVSDLQMTVSDAEESQTVDDQATIEQIVAEPLYFKLKNDGSITDVIASKSDSEEIVNLKTAVAFALSANLAAENSDGYSTATVIDPMGKHAVYTVQSQRGNAREIETYFSESDFHKFSDRQLDKDEIAVESQSKHILEDEKVTSATAVTKLVVNKEALSENDVEDEIPIIVSGTSTLSGYTQLDDCNVENGLFAHTAKFLSENRDFGMVAKFRQSYYEDSSFTALTNGAPRGRVARSSLSADNGNTGCPSACDVCQSTGASTTLGNSNVGLAASISGVIGVTKGCSNPQRSYIVGAYANLDIKVIGKTVSALNAYAEYGQVNGSPLRNGISISLFGKNLYSKTFPYRDCTSKSQKIFDTSKSFSIGVTIPVTVVFITLSAGISFHLRADVEYKICPNAFQASVTFKPQAEITISGSAKASVIAASAKVYLSGTISDWLDPTAYVDGNLCRIGFKVQNHFGGIKASLSYKYRVLIWKSKTHTIWSKTWGGSTQTLYDKYWGAK